MHAHKLDIKMAAITKRTAITKYMYEYLFREEKILFKLFFIKSSADYYIHYNTITIFYTQSIISGIKTLMYYKRQLWLQ